jgi:hypothetical protein
MISYETFSTFLTESGCANQFDIEFERQNPGYHLDANLWDILGGDEYFLSRAFDWSATSQGRDFWKDISEKWCHSCVDGNSSN